MEVILDEAIKIIKQTEPSINLVQDQLFKGKYWLVDVKNVKFWYSIDLAKIKDIATYTSPGINAAIVSDYLMSEFKKQSLGLEKNMKSKMKSFEKYFRKNS